MQTLHDLLNRRYTLQSDILSSWEELQKIKDRHSDLLNQLKSINAQIESETEPSLYDQLFS